MEKNLTDNDVNFSEIITYSRAIALVSIVSAHVQFSETVPAAISHYYHMIGSIGVILFMIIAGYYYYPVHYGTFDKMLERKLITVGLPWFCLGTIGFLYNGILSHNISIGRYVNFLFGNGSYLYYLSVLFLCFVLFYFLNTSHFCVIAVIINIVSLILTQLGLMDSVITVMNITNYLNPLNWIGFFAVGVLLRGMDTATICDSIQKYRIPTIIVCIAVYFACFLLNIQTGYFSAIGWIIELMGAATIIAIASFISKKCRLLKRVARYAYTVYLIHFMVIGVFDKVYNLAMPLQLFSNLIVIAISVVCIELCLLIAKMAKLEWLVAPILGVRKG